MKSRKKIIFFSTVFLLVLVSIVQLNKLYNWDHILDDQNHNQGLSFSKFPLNKSVPIFIDLPEYIEEEFTRREIENQIRDWILFTVISSINLPYSNINHITYDLPAIRYSCNNHIYNLKYGKTRTQDVGEGKIIAIIPEEAENKQNDYLLHIADEQRKNRGGIPDSLIIFTYSIDPHLQKVNLTRRRSLYGHELFTEKHNYYERKIASLEDLKNFINLIQDVTFAKIEDEKLILGGRNFQNKKYINIDIEDIAALWQSEESIILKWNSIRNKWKEKLTDEFYRPQKSTKSKSNNNSKTLSRLNVLLEQKDTLFDDNKIDSIKILNIISSCKTDIKKFKKIHENIFSLDPNYDQSLLKAKYGEKLKGTKVAMNLFYADLLMKMDLVNSSKVVKVHRVNKSSTIDLRKVNKNIAFTKVWFGANQNTFDISLEENLFLSRNIIKLYVSKENTVHQEDKVNLYNLSSYIDYLNNYWEDISEYEQEYQKLNKVTKWNIIIRWLNDEGEGSKIGFLKNVNVKKNYWFPEWIKKQKDLASNKFKNIKFYPKGYGDYNTEMVSLTHFITNDAPNNSNYLYGGIARGIGGIIRRIIRKNPKVPFPFHDDHLFNIPRKEANVLYDDYLKYLKNELSQNEGSLSESLKNTTKINYYSNILDEELGVFDKSLRTFANNENSVIDLFKNHIKTELNDGFTEIFGSTFQNFSTQQNFGTLHRYYNGENLIGKLKIENIKGAFQVGFESRDILLGQRFARKISDASDVHSFIINSIDLEAFIPKQKGKHYILKLRGSNKWMELNLEANSQVSISSQWQSRVSGTANESKICSLKWLNEGDIIATYIKSIVRKTRARCALVDEPENIVDEVLRSANPITLKVEVESSFKEEVREVDKLFAQKKYDESFEKLNNLEAYYGAKPQIKFRKGLVLIQMGDLKGRAYVNNLFEIKGKGKFYNEIKNLIEKSSLSAADKRFFQKFAQNTTKDLNTLKKKLSQKRVKLWVEDNPKLNNLDWNALNQKTGSNNFTLPDGIIIEELHRVPLSDYRFNFKDGRIEILDKTANIYSPYTNTSGIKIPSVRQININIGYSEEEEEEESTEAFYIYEKR